MTTSRLDRAIKRYATTLAALEKAAPNLSDEQILRVLVARDAVQAVLTDKTQDPPKDLMTVIQCDSRLKKQAKSIARAVRLADWRASLHPKPEAWWWFFEPSTPLHWRDRFDWLCSALTVVCLTVALSFVVDISSRFLSGGPDRWGALAVVAQSVLTMLTAGGTLTKAGREAVERTLTRLRLPKDLWQELNFILAA